MSQERLTITTLREKLNDVYDFALQLGLNVPNDMYDLTGTIEAIDQARAELRLCVLHGGVDGEGPGSRPRGGLEVPR